MYIYIFFGILKKNPKLVIPILEFGNDFQNNLFQEW